VHRTDLGDRRRRRTTELRVATIRQDPVVPSEPDLHDSAAAPETDPGRWHRPASVHLDEHD